MDTIRRIALALVLIGAINWGLIGLFQFDLVAAILGGQDSLLSRVVYTLVGISSLICLPLLFARDVEENMDYSQIGGADFASEFGEEPDLDRFNDPSLEAYEANEEEEENY